MLSCRLTRQECFKCKFLQKLLRGLVTLLNMSKDIFQNVSKYRLTNRHCVSIHCAICSNPKNIMIVFSPHNYSTIMIVPYLYINICLYVPCLLHNRWVNLNAQISSHINYHAIFNSIILLQFFGFFVYIMFISPLGTQRYIICLMCHA